MQADGSEQPATLQIVCCIQNLIRHQYGELLNELQNEGVDISVERCVSHCVGCVKQPAFMKDGTWHGVESKDQFKAIVYGLSVINDGAK